MLSISIHFYFNSIHFYSFLFISTNSYSCLVIHLYLYSFLMKSYSSLFIFNQDLCIFIHFYLNAVHFPRIEHHPKPSWKQTENVSLARLFNHLWGGVHDPPSLGPNSCIGSWSFRTQPLSRKPALLPQNPPFQESNPIPNHRQNRPKAHR